MKLALCGSQGKMGCIFLKTFADIYEIIEIYRDGICLNDIIDDVDLVVDFTNSRSAFVHGVIALTHDKPILIGSTGMSDHQKATLKKVADKRGVGCLLSSNFSAGIWWMKQYIEELAPYFTTIKIYEQHHKSKLDTPSGTALALASRLHLDSSSIQATRNDSYDVVHKIVFENPEEVFVLHHIVKDRKAYMGKLQECLILLQEIKGYVDVS